MRKTLTKVLAALMAIVVILPMVKVNNVNAAPTAPTAADVRNYILNNGTTSDGKKQVSTVHGSTTISISADTSTKKLYFLALATNSETNVTVQTALVVDLLTNTIVNNKAFFQISGTSLDCILSAPITFAYNPGYTNLNWTKISGANLTANQLQSYRTSASAMVELLLTKSNEILLGKNYCLGDIGFNQAAFQWQATEVTEASWLFTDGDKYYENTTIIDLEVAYVSGVDYKNMTSELTYNGTVLKSLPGRFGVYNANQTTVQTTNGCYPTGDYTITFYDVRGGIVYQDTCHVENTTGPELPAFVTGNYTNDVPGFVKRLYGIILHRIPNDDELNYWCSNLYGKTITGGTAAMQFLTSPEFTSAGYWDPNYIEILYRVFFNRTGDSDGAAYWLDQLEAGATHEDVINGFINSNEWKELCAECGIASGAYVDPVEAFATRLYTTCLGRDGETDGIAYWTTNLRSGAVTGTAAAQSFFFGAEFTSAEYSNQEFVVRLYKTFMDREGSSEDVAYWVNLLSSGVSREDVFSAFASSPEFAQRCADAGINA